MLVYCGFLSGRTALQITQRRQGHPFRGSIIASIDNDAYSPMDIIEHIAPETLQVIKEGIAQEYKIIPFEVSGGCCRCYGISGIEYDDFILEKRIVD